MYKLEEKNKNRLWSCYRRVSQPRLKSDSVVVRATHRGPYNIRILRWYKITTDRIEWSKDFQKWRNCGEGGGAMWSTRSPDIFAGKTTSFSLQVWQHYKSPSLLKWRNNAKLYLL